MRGAYRQAVSSPVSAVAEVPAGRFRQIFLIELLHPKHAREAEHPGWDDVEDRVWRRAGSGRVRAIDLVAVDLERPANCDQDLDYMSDGALVGEWLSSALDNNAAGGMCAPLEATEASNDSRPLGVSSGSNAMNTKRSMATIRGPW